MYTIGKLAEISQVSVRTLRYYDEIALLLPSKKNAAGHRFYSDDKVAKLQHILMLRDLGFNLHTIHQFLISREFDLSSVLKMRRKIIQEELDQLRKIEDSIEALIDIAETDTHMEWEKVFATYTSHSSKKQHLRESWTKYFSEEEQQIVDSFPVFGEKSGDESQWEALAQKVRANIIQDPASSIAQDMAKEWLELVDRMYQGNSKLANKVWELNKTKKPHQRVFAYEPEVILFIEQAIKHYYQQLKNLT
ncbi:MerR family transcriptional regulator [Planococcus maritimus]|nr:MerR family transcriptional regulator [Planococcus sp. SK3692]MDE4085301.1 MerR family transcriptional regulator [Planococcus maritimus]